MSRTLFVFVMLLIAVLAPLGCSPTTSKGMADSTKVKTGDMTKGMVDAATSAAGDMAQKSGIADMVSKATDALSSVEGGPGMLKDVQDSIGKTMEALKSVTDADTATAALPELGKLTESFGSMTDMYNKLPAAAKSAVAGIFTSALGELKPIVDKVLAIPGVEPIMKPAIDTLMSKLNSFAA